MRVHFKLGTFGIPQTETYPDEEIIYFKVFSMWLRVHFSHIWYFEHDDAGEVIFSEPSTGILSIEAVDGLPTEAESLHCYWIHDAEYDLKKTRLSLPIRKRILHLAVDHILGRQSPGCAMIRI